MTRLTAERLGLNVPIYDPAAYYNAVKDAPGHLGAEAVALEVGAGSVVFFHDHLPHYSSQNRSERSRHAFTLHVGEQHAAWSEKNWLQRPALGDFRL